VLYSRLVPVLLGLVRPLLVHVTGQHPPILQLVDTNYNYNNSVVDPDWIRIQEGKNDQQK
jgi:hypothetical protein